MDYKNNKGFLKHLIAWPFIWIIIIPLVILDIFIEIHHRICFPIYGIPCLKRKDYIRIDRHKLKYLKWFDKINCVYCGYANGLLHYAYTIAGLNEKYWCGIKSKDYPGFIPPEHQKNFLKYGDEDEFKKKYPNN